jgi:hypothetical protein
VSWYDNPYPTNPKPPAVQQPRALYPPDVKNGYAPSSDGPDIEAIKRGVSRLGRWPWAEGGKFDQDYSARFAHGEAGGNVDDSGIAGIQRQSGLDDTGNLGSKTFQIIRCALVPDGLPHAGEPALDGYALELLNGTKWNKYPYAEGPGAGSVKFPRTLYPPDYPNQPSPSDGPDVQAHKRALSRLGRWPWQQFNATYTNEFAHGASGNVGDTGVEGFQRQTPELDPTGVLTEKLYGHLLRALVPPCLPHSGEYGYDGKALELLDEANKRQPAGSIRRQALDEARKWIGTTESPAGSNQCRFTAWYGMVGPWCAMFATYCYELGSPGGSASFAKGSYYAYVPYIVSDARSGRRGLSVPSSPVAGDLVCYDWGGDGVYDHVGLIESGDGRSWQAIEGNTSSDSGGSQSNGGGVYRRSRSRSQAGAVTFVRVAE